MLRKETCYFCTSTYQLFAIVSLAVSRKEKADLYIDPQFKDAEEIADRIKEASIFDTITIINRDEVYTKYFKAEKGFMNHVEIAKSYCHADDIAKIVLGKDIIYHNIFVSSRAYLPRMVILNHLKHDSKVQIHFFDDGVGSYYKSAAYKPQKLDGIIRRIIFGRKAVDIDSDLYLFSPALYRAINRDEQKMIAQIQRIWEEPQWLDFFNYVFGMSHAKALEQRVIILEEPYSDFFPADQEAKLQRIYDQIIKRLGQNNCVIKKHPRSEKSETEGLNYYADFGIPFEMLCMNSKIEESLLISYGSTAAISPKLLLDKEPRVIMLYDLVKSDQIDRVVLDAVFKGAKATYSKTEAFCIPSNKKELTEAMEEYAVTRGVQYGYKV